MALFPFRRNRSQLPVAIILAIAGFLLMIGRTGNIGGLRFNGFLAGAILFFVGMLYFLDAQ